MYRCCAVVIAALLFAVAPSSAAPTCQNMDGDTVRCGTTGAMPVGWTLPAQQRQQKESINPTQLLELFCGIGAFLALLALMPDFDGSRPGDWDREEGDDQDVRL